MRVLVANTFYYRRGGDCGQFLDLVQQLTNRGHAVATFSMSHPQNLESDWSDSWAPYIDYHGRFGLPDKIRALGRSTYSFESARRIRELIRDFRPDVAHFHSVQHQLTVSVLRACKAESVPVVWTLHDYRTVCPGSALLSKGAEICERCAGGSFWHGAAGRCRSGELARSLGAACECYMTRAMKILGDIDCYVAPSEFLARKVVQMGLPARRMEVLPNPVESSIVSQAQQERSGLLYVGRLLPEKGVKCLIEAVAGLEDVHLDVLGEGQSSTELEELASRLSANVTFHGWADTESVREHMARAELLCVPSIWYENCPGVVLEAMIGGLPVLASDLGGLTELLDGGRVGWLAAAGDLEAWRSAIRVAMADRAESRRKADLATSWVKSRHDPDAFAERLERIYSSLIGDRG